MYRRKKKQTTKQLFSKKNCVQMAYSAKKHSRIQSQDEMGTAC